MNMADMVREKIGQLQDMLLTAHPRMPSLLEEIHNHLRQDPEIVTLISEAEVKLIVDGLKKQTNTDIATTIAKSKTSAGKSLKNITTADL